MFNYRNPLPIVADVTRLVKRFLIRHARRITQTSNHILSLVDTLKLQENSP